MPGLLLSGLLLAGTTFTTFPTPPPVPSPQPVTEQFFGTTVTDPYRYFENMQDPVVVQFFKEQNAYARY
jgi:prolyl oligopeptidase